MILNRVLSRDEALLARDSIMSYVTLDRFHARGIVQTGNSIEQWHIEVDRTRQEWFAVDESGHVHEHREHSTVHRGLTTGRVTKITDELVGPLALAFPETLIWWGQHPDGFWPVLIERLGKRSLLITFEHGVDPSMRTTMVIDTELGVVTRILPFNSPMLLLLDVETDRAVQRILPRSFPEPEVLYPDY